MAVTKTFPVLRLPPEIRNRIWRFAVVKEEEVIIYHHGRQSLASNLPESRLRSRCPLQLHQQDDERRLSSQLAVAFTSRQLYLEVTPIYYGLNTFSLSNYRRRKDYQQFAADIGPDNVNTITTISAHGDQYFLYWCIPMLRGLKRVHVHQNLPPSLYGIRLRRFMTMLGQKYPSLRFTYDGEVWGPSKWELYPSIR